MDSGFKSKPLPGTENLKSKWNTTTTDLSGANPPVRLEGEIGDVIVRGTIPDAIDGTFYRVAQDPFTPPAPHNVSIEGHGVVSAFRIHKGSVDFKMRYIQTERYLTERKARTSLFGLYKNPWSDHPCVRGVVDSTANTNIIYWAGSLLALRESANPYSLDPDSLDTNEYDPFGKQVTAEAFTAHPKIDPFTNELIVFGYEAKGPGSDDIVTYSIDKNGHVKNETWVKSPYVTFVHDMVLTENWIVLILWPFEADVDPSGWEENDKIYSECSRSHHNFFPFFPAKDGREAGKTVVDFVRFEIDLNQSTGSNVDEPRVLLDIPNEFPRIDERYMSKNDTKKLLFSGLNAVAMINTRTGEQQSYWPGENCYCQEPAFVPRSDDAPEGDGWVMFVVERRDLNVSNLVIVDTRDFKTPIAVAELPLRVRPQIHGNWVDSRELNDKPLVSEPGEIKLSSKACNLKVDIVNGSH
ncbi:lignostilbene alpha,beta-dioxygenase I [Fusarium fujikuroi]|nr:lignostilbene alpha,beta-dioxygenase I [Fusarium fujikuroi]